MLPPFSAFEHTLRVRFGNVLSAEGHASYDGRACAIECAHATVGDEWSHQPDKWPDVRPINDDVWQSDEDRTEHMTRLMRAYWHWSEWTPERQAAVIAQLIVLTAQRIVSQSTKLPEEIAYQCRDAITPEEAASAAYEAGSQCVAYAHHYLKSGRYIDATRAIANAAAWIDSADPHAIIDVWIDAAEAPDGSR